MDHDHERSKQKQIERYQQGMKRFRTLAERKALEQESRERRARRGRSGRDEDEEDLDDGRADDDPRGHVHGAARRRDEGPPPRTPRRDRAGRTDASRGRDAAQRERAGADTTPDGADAARTADAAERAELDGRPELDERAEQDEQDAATSATAAAAAAAAVEHAGPAPNARAEPSLLEALVVGLAPGRARVRPRPAGEECDARLSEPLARTQRASIAVGDRVHVRPIPGHLAVVESVLARRSLLARLDSARPGGQQLVAANVDRAVVVAAAAQPAFRPRLVDRYLVALERGRIAPFVALGKVDLVDQRERGELGAFLEELAAIGVPGALVSTVTGEGLDAVRAAVEGTTFVLVGQSGVGKSSLANALFPAVAARTGAVRTGDGKGRHTTTAAHLFAVDARGTCVIDTPGVRSFGLANLARAELAAYFPDFDAHRAACRFADCSHSHEPDCGVRAAVLAGELAARRHAAYLRILESLA